MTHATSLDQTSKVPPLFGLQELWGGEAFDRPAVAMRWKGTPRITREPPEGARILTIFSKTPHYSSEGGKPAQISLPREPWRAK